MSFLLELKSGFCDKNNNLLFILPARKWICLLLFIWLISNFKIQAEHLIYIYIYIYIYIITNTTGTLEPTFV